MIDSNPKVINTLGETFHRAIECDCTDINELLNIGVQDFDYVILGITSMETSVITAANLKELNVSNIICKAKDDKHRRILNLLGVTISFIPEEEVAAKVAYKAMYDMNAEFLSLEDTTKSATVVEFPILNEDIWNKKVSEIDFFKQASATLLNIKKKDGKIKTPVNGDDLLEEGDSTCVLCNKEQIRKIQHYLTNN